MNNLDYGKIEYRNELVRKSIHLFSLTIPITYYFIPLELGLKILIPMTVFSVLIDTLRNFNSKTRQIINKYFGFMLREHELDANKKTFTGASFVLLSALITALLFPKVIFLTAFTVLIISDTTAALVGRKIGKTKFLRKSLEGTLAFIISAFIVISITPKVSGSSTEYLIGFVAATIGAFGENISYGWADDNFVIPLSIGFTMWVLYLLVLPELALVLPNVPV